MTAEEYLNSSLDSSDISADDFLNQQLEEFQKPVEEEGFLRQAADIPVNIFKGGVTGTRMVTDIFGAANPVSKALAGVEDYMDSLLSAEAKRDQQEIARILEDAQDKGVLDQVMAGVEAFSVAPADTLANAMGTMIPVLATGLAGSAARLAPVAVKGIQLGMGAAMGAGTVKGEIYNSVYSELEQQGVDAETADKTASQAQAYGGKNLDQILIGAGLGTAAASTGAEKILTAVLTKQGKGVTGGIVQRAIKGGITEAPLEGLQGGQEKLATNLALQREGFDVPTMRGVVSQATMEATAGLGAGGIAGVFGKVESEETREEKDIESDVNKVARELSAPAGDDNAKAIINETNRVEQKIQNNKEMLSVMEPTSSEYQRLSNEIAMDEKNLVALKQATEKVTGVSEPITSVEQQQAELARAIAEEPVAPEVAPAEEVVTPAPVEAAPAEQVTAPVTEQVVTPEAEAAPVEPTEVVAPTEIAPEVVTPVEPVSEPITPAPTITEPAAEATAPEVAPVKELTEDEAETIRDVITLRKSQGREPNPEQVKRLAEYDAKKAGIEVQMGDIVSNIVVGHPMFESPQPELNNLVPIKVTTKEELASPIQRAQQVRDKAQSYIGSYQVEQAKAKAPSQKKAFAKKFTPSELARQRDILDYIKNDVMPELDRLEKLAPSATPAPTTAPAGPAVGNRIRLGRSPQSYVIEEVIPQTEAEKELGEQYYNVKNERTGEVQTVEAKDLKLVKQKPVREALAEAVPTPEDKRLDYGDIAGEIVNLFGDGITAERLSVIDDVDRKVKASYDTEDGIIEINLAYVSKDDNIRDILAHELGHYIAGDKKLKAKFEEFLKSIPRKDRKILEDFVDEVYNKRTGEVRLEEKQVRAFVIRLGAGENRTKFQKLLDDIKKWLNDKLGTKFKMTDRDAALILASAIDRFKSGEFIAREEEVGAMEMAAEVERGTLVGLAITREKTTPKDILAKTVKIIKKQVFDGDSEITEGNTTKAWNLISKLEASNPDSTDNAEAINQLTRETMQEVKLPENATPQEVETLELIKETVGMPKLRNELYQYAIKMAGLGDKKMLSYLLNNKLNLTGKSVRTDSDLGRFLGALRGLSSWIINATEAEQTGFFSVAAQQFFNTKNPTEEQIEQIQAMFNAVKKVKIDQEKELSAELEEVGKATGIDVADRVTKEVARGAKAKAESEADILSKEYYSIQSQAEAQIERLAEIQSDTPSFAKSKRNEIKKIVNDDLKNTPDMGRKEAWKSMLTAKLKDAGVNETDASLLSELVWRQHEINDTNRKMDETVKAVEKGAIKGIVDAILNTPLAEQQNPEWRKEVIKKYLIDAGVASSKADNIAKLFDISLQKRFAEAQVKAAEKAAKSIVGKLTPNSRRAFDKFIRAIRAQALAPDTDVAKAFGQQMGYRGFTAEEYARISELDQVINNEQTLDLERATAFKQIQNILSKASIPPRVRDAISSFYVAQALSGIPTATVNFFSPIGYALRYAMTDGMKAAIKNPAKLPTVFSAMLSSFKSYASEVAYSWNNNVQRRGVVEYLANDEKLLAVYNNGKKQWAEGNRAEGFKNMLFGSMEYVSRMLKALDEGALSVLEQQGLSRYAMAAMDAAGIKTSEQIAVANMVMKSKQEFILNSIAKGMNKRDAIAFSDDVYRSAWREALSDLKLDSQMVLDSAINDALSAVGRINITTDPLSGKEQKRVSDRGFASSIPISFLEAMSNAANAKTSNEIQRIFYRMMYGFAIVPARVMREAAWFSPYGFVRFAIDKGAKAKGYASPYEQSLGTDVQRSQRFIEATAGTIVMLGAMAMAKSSVDDPEDELPFKIVFTGNGPDRRLDPQFFDTWRKKFKPNSINIFFGKTKFSINIERGFEAFAVPFMFAGAIDDWRIRKQFEKTKKSPKDLSDAAIILGSAFMSFNKRGPYSAFTNVYSSYKNSDNMIAEMAKQGAFYGKTFIPVIGSSLARNVSDFINDPIDRTSLEGALYSNIPVLGPMMGTKSMNAVGQTQGATDFSDRLYKAGIPLVFSLPKNNESQRINELILKQGQGPTIPTRYNVRQRLGYEPTNKQYEVFVTAYGQYMAKKMTQSHASLMKKEPVSYMKWLERKSDSARSVATKEAKKIAPPKNP